MHVGLLCPGSEDAPVKTAFLHVKTGLHLRGEVAALDAMALVVPGGAVASGEHASMDHNETLCKSDEGTRDVGSSRRQHWAGCKRKRTCWAALQRPCAQGRPGCPEVRTHSTNWIKRHE